MSARTVLLERARTAAREHHTWTQEDVRLVEDVLTFARSETERSILNANHYATNRTPEAGRVCQYWRGRAAAFREIVEAITSTPVKCSS